MYTRGKRLWVRIPTTTRARIKENLAACRLVLGLKQASHLHRKLLQEEGACYLLQFPGHFFRGTVSENRKKTFGLWEKKNWKELMRTLKFLRIFANGILYKFSKENLKFCKPGTWMASFDSVAKRVAFSESDRAHAFISSSCDL
jgi:hypothetical protein